MEGVYCDPAWTLKNAKSTLWLYQGFLSDGDTTYSGYYARVSDAVALQVSGPLNVKSRGQDESRECSMVKFSDQVSSTVVSKTQYMQQAVCIPSNPASNNFNLRQTER